jgi:hypothetical protein
MKWNRKHLSCWMAVAVVLTLALPVHADPVGDTWARWGDLWSWFAGWWKAGIDRDPDGRAQEGPGEPSEPAGINRDPDGRADKAGIDSDPDGKPQVNGDADDAGVNGDPWG